MTDTEHQPDWSGWQHGDDHVPGCSCGFNGTFDECRAFRLAEKESGE